VKVCGSAREELLELVRFLGLSRFAPLPVQTRRMAEINDVRSSGGVQSKVRKAQIAVQPASIVNAREEGPESSPFKLRGRRISAECKKRPLPDLPLLPTKLARRGNTDIGGDQDMRILVQVVEEANKSGDPVHARFAQRGVHGRLVHQRRLGFAVECTFGNDANAPLLATLADKYDKSPIGGTDEPRPKVFSQRHPRRNRATPLSKTLVLSTSAPDVRPFTHWSMFSRERRGSGHRQSTETGGSR
jgi:hypothetical protein